MVAPVYVSDPFRVRVPAPACVTDPVPEIAPEKAILSVRLKIRLPLLITSPDRLPTVPPAPI